jgi:hypothetical protein
VEKSTLDCSSLPPTWLRSSQTPLVHNVAALSSLDLWRAN